MKPPFIRSPYNYDVKEASDSSSLATVGESLTVQSQSEDADINVLMKRYGITGKFPDNARLPTYGDFSEITDFRTALESVQNAHNEFMKYPAEFRARFDNDPQNFLLFATNPANIHELKKLGLLREGNSYDRAISGNNGARAGASSEGSTKSGSASASGSAEAGRDKPGDQSGGSSG